MRPVEMIILLEVFYIREPLERLTVARSTAIEVLKHKGLIEDDIGNSDYDNDGGAYMTTSKGNLMVKMLEDTPTPVPSSEYVDPRCG